MLSNWLFASETEDSFNSK